MRSLSADSPLKLLLIRLIAAAVLVAYLNLEPTFNYQISAIGLTALVWLSSSVRGTVTLMYLYTLFLLSLCCLYLLHYEAPPLLVISLTGAVYLTLRFLAVGKSVPLKRTLVVTLLLLEALLLGSYLSIGLFLYATAATAIGSADLLSDSKSRLLKWKI